MKAVSRNVKWANAVEFVNKTILEGSYYEHSKTSWNESNHKWTLTSDSRHVVSFTATFRRQKRFRQINHT